MLLPPPPAVCRMCGGCAARRLVAGGLVVECPAGAGADPCCRGVSTDVVATSTLDSLLRPPLGPCLQNCQQQAACAGRGARSVRVSNYALIKQGVACWPSCCLLQMQDAWAASVSPPLCRTLSHSPCCSQSRVGISNHGPPRKRCRFLDPAWSPAALRLVCTSSTPPQHHRCLPGLLRLGSPNQPTRGHTCCPAGPRGALFSTDPSFKTAVGASQLSFLLGCWQHRFHATGSYKLGKEGDFSTIKPMKCSPVPSASGT
jgi:hypothetical protein